MDNINTTYPNISRIRGFNSNDNMIDELNAIEDGIFIRHSMEFFEKKFYSNCSMSKDDDTFNDKINNIIHNCYNK